MADSNVTWRCCAYSMSKVRGKPILLVVLLVFALYMWECLSPIRDFLCDYDVSINVFGLYSYLLIDTDFLFVTGIGLLMIFGDAPFFDNAQLNVLVRSGQRTWLRGQLIYIGITTILYLAGLFVLMTLILLPHVCFSPAWGKALNTLIQTNAAEQYGSQLCFPQSIGHFFEPVPAMLISVMLRWFVLCTCAMIMFTVNFAFRTKAGALAAFLVIVMDFAAGFRPYRDYIYSISSMARLDILLHGISPYYPNPVHGIIAVLLSYALMLILTVFVGRVRDIAGMTIQ